MIQSNFSQRLSLLMKQRGISGQKIGDLVGKSQKTISRYANGETEPPEKLKKQILQAVASISGIEEDAFTTEELLINSSSGDMDEYETGAGLEYGAEQEENLQQMEKQFDRLNTEAALYCLQHMETFLCIEAWELNALEFYKELSRDRQTAFMDELERYDYKFSSDSCKNSKISRYILMMDCCEKRPASLYAAAGKPFDSRLHDSLKRKWLQTVREMEMNGTEISPEASFLPFLTFGPYDWYFLSRLQILELYDSARNYVWEMDGSLYGMVGIKFLNIISEIRGK